MRVFHLSTYLSTQASICTASVVSKLRIGLARAGKGYLYGLSELGR